MKPVKPLLHGLLAVSVVFVFAVELFGQVSTAQNQRRCYRFYGCRCRRRECES